MNYYYQFIKPPEITRDINFFSNQLKELVCNDIYTKYLRDHRKKINKIYTVTNFLSSFDKTKLQFINDKIDIEYIINDDLFNAESKVQNDISTSIIKYYDSHKYYKISNVYLNIKVNLRNDEIKNRLIYSDNKFFFDARKSISFIHFHFYNKMQKIEFQKFNFINNKISKLNSTYYDTWNHLIKYLLDATDKNFLKNMHKFSPIIKSLRINKLSILFDLVRQTQFYMKNNHIRQIKSEKFIQNLKKEILDDEEFVYMVNNLSKCFNHEIKNYEDGLIFLMDIINHFNYIFNIKEKMFLEFVEKKGKLEKVLRKINRLPT